MLVKVKASNVLYHNFAVKWLLALIVYIFMNFEYYNLCSITWRKVKRIRRSFWIWNRLECFDVSVFCWGLCPLQRLVTVADPLLRIFGSAFRRKLVYYYHQSYHLSWKAPSGLLPYLLCFCHWSSHAWLVRWIRPSSVWRVPLSFRIFRP